MNCPHCASTTTKERTKKTSLGYRTFRCSICTCAFNERSGTPFNYLEYPTDIVLLVVLYRFRGSGLLENDVVKENKNGRDRMEESSSQLS